MLYLFDNFILDTDLRELHRGGDAIPLQPQVFDLLEYLIRHRDRVVTKDDLIASIWGGRIVSESALTTRINAARTAIGDSGDEQRLIKTLPRKGIRFVEVVREDERRADAPAAVIEAAANDTSPPVRERHPSPERRQLTVVSSELKTDGAPAGMDVEELRDLVGAWRASVVEVANRFNGRVGHSFGRTVLIYFGYPVASEDDAEQAVRAALELCAATKSLEPGRNIRLRARLGVATGPVVFGGSSDRESDDQAPVGEAPGTAAQLQGAARSDTVLIDSNTRRLIGSLFDCHDVEPIRDPENGSALRAWEVVGASLIESRFEALRPLTLTPLVGREEEIELLLRRWIQTKSGEGRMVLITGEPGIGKSRLVAALQDRLRNEPHTRLRYFCASTFRDSALRPIVNHIEHVAGFEARETPDGKIQKLEKMVGHGCTPEELALVADLLAIPTGERYPRLELTPKRKREKTFEALLRRIETLAASNPVLMIFEDLHWIDPTSLELLDRVIERVARLPILLVITSRPEITSSWSGLPHAMTLVLSRLTRRDGAAMVAQIEGARTLPRELVDRIAERTDGVPLFIEEMTKAVVESQPADAPISKLSPPSGSLAVPTSLHGSLMARLDRIGPGRTVAQIGAVIGRHFSFELISAMSLIGDDQLRSGLQELVDAQLIYCRGMPPDAEYTFKHALVQDVAYESVLKSRRAHIHRTIAETIQRDFASLGEAQPELLGYHLTEAGKTDEAIAAWQRAGEGALYRAAYIEAAQHLGKAIALANLLPEGTAERLLRFKLQIAHGNALIPARGYGASETTAAFARAAELAAGIEDAATRFPALYGLWVGSLVRGEPEAIRTLSEAFLSDAERDPGSPELLVGHRIVGASRWYDGDYAGAQTHLERALGAYDKEAHRLLAFHYGQDIGVAAMIFMALTLWPTGEIGRARGIAEEALSYAPSTGHIATVAYALTHICILELLCRDKAALSRHGKALVAISREHGLRFWFGYGAFATGHTRWHAGERDGGAMDMLSGIAMLKDQGIAWCLPLLQSVYAETEAQRGHTDTALAILDEALAFGEQTGQRWIEADLHRVRGDILLDADRPDLAAAESALNRAIDIARGQRARTFELRSALSLARLYRATNRDAAARPLLASALQGFSQIQELPEIEQAQRLFSMPDP